MSDAPVAATSAMSNGDPPGGRWLTLGQSVFRGVAIPFLAVFTALVIGAVFLLIAGFDPLVAYWGLLVGAFGDAAALTRTLVKTTPLILSGLAVAFAFKGGLFNIGGQGQLIMGATFSAWVGFALQVKLGPMILFQPAQLGPPLGFTEAVIWPYPIPSTIAHLSLALLAGASAGALWGAIPGVLKAYTGAHEVITTIMFNFIAANLINFLVYAGAPGEGRPPGPMNDGNGVIARTPNVLNTAHLPMIYDPPGPQELHLGLFIAILAAVLLTIVIARTTFGFELRMVGLNPTAARYSGISVPRITVLTMMVAGAMAGLAGSMQTLGVNHRYEPNQSLGLGFDAITVSLMAGNSPMGVILSAFLFGAMEAGGTKMQYNSEVPTEIILVIQALILMFVAAEQIVRMIYRIKGEGGIQEALSSGWGQR